MKPGRPTHTKTTEEMRELAIQRAADRVRDVLSVLDRALPRELSSMGDAAAALTFIANASYAQALSEVMTEHQVIDPRLVAMLESSPFGPGGLGGPGGLVGLMGGLGNACSTGGAGPRMSPSPSSPGEIDHVKPHPFLANPFLPKPGKPETTPLCEICGQEEGSLFHHPELIASAAEPPRSS